ncbi:MAG: glycosyltransferase family protein [Desulfococcaceae bacterium]
MKILVYCQHVLGVGHFFRTLEICRALRGHEVVLVTGGSPAPADLPVHVREIRLPGLMMDEEFKGLHAAGDGPSVEEIQTERRDRFMEIVRDEAPELMLVELYPFGRKKFRFELDPVLKAIRSGELPPCRVACSLRDILVEKADTASYEERVVSTLNRYFDAVLIHADPELVRLDETFSRLADIAVPVVYTGFVTPRPPAGARERMRKELGLPPETALIVASAGGGKVGAPLLEAAVQTVGRLGRDVRLQAFTGPFMEDEIVSRLRSVCDSRIAVERFTPDFLSWLAAADLSISMGGYNTTMNLLAARTPSLVWPFAQNREQRLRAERIARHGGLELLSDEDLEPARLAEKMAAVLDRRERPGIRLDLDGAEATARWISRQEAAGE